MIVRSATADDVPHVLPMVSKLAQLHESWDPAKYPYLPGVAEMYRSWLTTRARDDRSVFLVAQTDDGRTAGFLVGTAEREIPIYRLKEFGFIHDMWVESEYRHEGLGRQMTMLAIEKFRGLMGLTQVRLDTAAANDAGRGLFKTCGFRPSVTEMLLEMEPQMNTDHR